MNDFNLFPDTDVAEYGEEREDSRKGTFAIDDKKRYVVNFDPIGEIPNAFPVTICVSDNNNLVAAVYEIAGKLIDMSFDASWLRKEEIAAHGYVVCATRHIGEFGKKMVTTVPRVTI